MRRIGFGSALLLVTVVGLLGCSGEVVSTPTEAKSNGTPAANGAANSNGAKAEEKLSGDIAIAGSSTVFLIADEAKEAFSALHSDVKIGLGEGEIGRAHV